MSRSEDILLSFIGELLKKISPQSIIKRNVMIEDGLIDARDERTGSRLSVPLPRKGRMTIISVGKAAPSMMSAIRGLGGLPARCEVRYLVLSNHIPDAFAMADATVIEGNHPVPDARDIENVRTVKDLLQNSVEGDLVLLLLSGGASSLLFSPREGVAPDLKSSLIRGLMLSGADISSLNTVRTYLSDTKGGGLLRWTGPAEVLTLVFSDVMYDDLRYVGSGPTFPNDPGRDEVLAVIERFDIDPVLISEVKRIPRRDPVMPKGPFHNVIIGNSDSAVLASRDILSQMGFSAFAERAKFSGEARTSAPILLDNARKALDVGYDVYVQGGETTVTVKGTGRGGRNLEMALSAITSLRKNETVLCFATDGSDGNSGYAGALVRSRSGTSEGIAKALSNNDSARFFDSNPGGIRTGPTGQNLGDLFLLLRGPLRPSPGHPRPGRQT